MIGKNANTALILLLSATILFSCRKDVPESIEEEVEFQVSFDLDGQPKTFKAGVDNYYMTTQTSLTGDSMSLVQFEGIFENVVEGNKEKIGFRIRNRSKGQSASFSDLSSVLRNESLDYYYFKDKLMFEVALRAHKLAPNSVYTWDYGDGETQSVTTDSVVHFFDASKLKYRICLSIDNLQGCKDEICSDIFLPGSPLTAKISSTPLAGSPQTNDILYSANDMGISPITYNWTFSSGNTANTREVRYAYDLNQALIEEANLKILDGQGNLADLSYKQIVGAFPDNCYANFDYQVGDTLTINDPGFEQVELFYIDSDGHEYISSFDQQPGSSFIVLNYFAYLENMQGQQTMAMDIDFNCLLYDDQGKSIKLSGGSGRIAVAY